jgi:zinc protease
MQIDLLDRGTPPKPAPLEKVLFPAIRQETLQNGVVVHLLQFGTQEILELTALFPAGKCFEPAASVSSFTTKMMQEGTRSHSSLEYARAIDNYGAFVHVDSGYEAATVSLTSLSKHLAHTVPLWAELILEPVFPASEMEKLRERSLQHLDVEEQKTSYITRREFNRQLFGQAHPYGSPTTKADLESLELVQLGAFHASHFHPENAAIIAVGKFDEQQLLAALDATVGAVRLEAGHQKIDLASSHGRWEAATAARGLHYFEKADSMQATLRVGHRAFARNHPDYYPMQVVNTIYGGYFGSRLMKNIREEKGYTYGISSAWLAMKYAGLFVIQTDVGNAYIGETLAEIKKELQRLLDHGVSEAELDLVRNYTLGRSATGRETPTQLNHLMQTALLNGYTFGEVDRKHDIVMALKPADILQLAHTYLRPSEMLEVVCGKMDA